MSQQVYLAGPCFSAAERRWNEDVLRDLESVCPSDFWFYLPQERVREDWPRTKIQQTLVDGLITTDVLIANLDGPGGDDGTCWEMGFMAGMNTMALSLGRLQMCTRRIFWYRTDFRNGGDSDFNVNLMMAYGGTQIILSGTTPADVAKDISRALIKLA